MSGKERLSQLLALAAERRWTPLARELADLMLYWPADYPDAMREPVEALSETAFREADNETQKDVATRLAGHKHVPLKLMNVLYLAAPAPVRREILLRNALEGTPDTGVAADAGALVEAARQGGRDFAGIIAKTGAIPRRLAQKILSDGSGEALAVLCRGLTIDRASFSAIALLRGAENLPLWVFETVDERAAKSLVQCWQHSSEAQPQHVAA